MAKMNNGEALSLNGAYAYKVYIGTGSAKLQAVDGGETAVDIADTSVTASAQKRIDYCGRVQLVTTGDAQVYLDEIAL